MEEERKRREETERRREEELKSKEEERRREQEEEQRRKQREQEREEQKRLEREQLKQQEEEWQRRRVQEAEDSHNRPPSYNLVAGTTPQLVNRTMDIEMATPSIRRYPYLAHLTPRIDNLDQRQVFYLFG